MIECQKSSWAALFADQDFHGLVQEHLAERYARVPTELRVPNYHMYEVLEQAEALLVVEARSAQALVGYAICTVYRAMHYDKICGYEDGFFVAKRLRKGLSGVGAKLFLETKKQLLLMGVKEMIFSGATPSQNKFYSKLGGKIVGTAWLLEGDLV